MDAIIEAEVMYAQGSIQAPSINATFITPMVPALERMIMASVSMVRRLSRGRTSLSAVAPSFHEIKGGMTALAYAA